ncbi:MAG TPA: hypothetical protein VI544_00120 [Candidatus Nanoarchaeia archaeon]|nr:hypothetical protein [Candidatus Nanoarchaeia archaeon]
MTLERLPREQIEKILEVCNRCTMRRVCEVLPDSHAAMRLNCPEYKRLYAEMRKERGVEEYGR